MTPACDPPLLDTLSKVGFAVLGALVGAAATGYLARKRLRRLIPVVEARIALAARACSLAYTQQEAADCKTRLEAAMEFAQEAMAAGLSPRRWQDALTHLRHADDAAAQCQGVPAALVPAATQALRQRGAVLARWAAGRGR